MTDVCTGSFATLWQRGCALVTLVSCPIAFGAIEVNLTLDQTSYFVGEPIHWSLTVTNTSDEQVHLSFPVNQTYWVAFDQEPSRPCWGADVVLFWDLAPQQSISKSGRWFLSDAGSHTLQGRLCKYDYFAEPVSFQVIEPPPMTEDVFIDFERFPDGTPTEWSYSHMHVNDSGFDFDPNLDDAFAQWGVYFSDGSIVTRPMALAGEVWGSSGLIRADLRMPVYGVSAEVVSRTYFDTTAAAMTAYGSQGQILAHVVSGGRMSLVTEEPIAFVLWESTNGTRIVIDDVGFTVQTALPLLSSPQGLDINGDGALTVDDLDLISAELLRSQPRLEFDLDQNGLVDHRDRSAWLAEYGQLRPGDADLDGLFTTTDLVSVFIANEYEDRLPRNSTWETGDWDGDLEFTSGDLVAAFQIGHYEEARTAIRSVPESTSTILFVLGGLLGIGIERRRSSSLMSE